jgi:hypothetical protein
MSVNEPGHIKRMQAIHADQEDVVDIGRLGARAKCHAGQQAECDLSQYHKIVLHLFLLPRRAIVAAVYFMPMTGRGASGAAGRRARRGNCPSMMFSGCESN